MSYHDKNNEKTLKESGGDIIAYKDAGRCFDATELTRSQAESMPLADHCWSICNIEDCNGNWIAPPAPWIAGQPYGPFAFQSNILNPPWTGTWTAQSPEFDAFYAWCVGIVGTLNVGDTIRFDMTNTGGMCNILGQCAQIICFKYEGYLNWTNGFGWSITNGAVPTITLDNCCPQPPPPCDHQDMMNAAGATVFPIYLNAGALSNFTNFTTNMWNNYIGVVGNISGCDWWWNRWTHWTGQIATGTITNPTQLALKSEKINFVEEMLNNCGCYGVSSPQNIASNIDSYDCVGNNRCVLVGETEIGQFTSLSACQDNCGDGGWNCQALAGYQSCYQVDLPSIGTYATLLDCQAGFINGGLGPCKTMESWDDKDDAPPERFKRPTKRSHKNKKY